VTSEPTPTDTQADQRTDSPTSIDSLTDPESLRDEAVAFVETTETHDDPEDCPTDVVGRAMVGVGNDDGETLVSVFEEPGVVLLPHTAVEQDGDWAETIVDLLADRAGLGIELDGVARVRVFDHYVAGEDDPRTTTHQVVFAGSTVGDDAVDDGCTWATRWVESVPEGFAPPGEDAGSDLALFLG